LVLHLPWSVAIVPVHLPTTEETRPPSATTPALSLWVRAALIGIASVLVAIFGVALWLDPYDQNGNARRMGTHLQAGLPPCTFHAITGVPCPSCGMTTSFALLVRGDVMNSLRANAVGTILALFWLALIPWSLACAIGRRYYGFVSSEWAVLVVVIVFVVLLTIRWAVVLGLSWWNGTPF